MALYVNTFFEKRVEQLFDLAGRVEAAFAAAGLEYRVIGGLASWIGALLNTWQLESRAWFVGLLLLGIFNLGFFAMVAYLLAGPDGTETDGVAPRPTQTVAA